jgi:hypothetical protein
VSCPCVIECYQTTEGRAGSGAGDFRYEALSRRAFSTYHLQSTAVIGSVYSSTATLCSYCHEVMDIQGHHTLAACATPSCRLQRHNGVVRLCTAPSSVQHSSIQVAGHGLFSRGAPTVLQTCSPLRAAWTLIILISLATLLTSRSATQSVRKTCRWSGKCSLHLVPRAPKSESGGSFSRTVERSAAVAPGRTPDFLFHALGLT